MKKALLLLFAALAMISAQTFSISGLPKTLVIDAQAGTISGLPLIPGTYTFQLHVTTEAGANVAQTFTVTIAALPTHNKKPADSLQ